jgi:hypothetical protein
MVHLPRPALKSAKTDSDTAPVVRDRKGVLPLLYAFLGVITYGPRLESVRMSQPLNEDRSIGLYIASPGEDKVMTPPQSKECCPLIRSVGVEGQGSIR